MPLGAACYPDVVFCVPAESCGATGTCCVTSHCVTASDDSKSEDNFVASAQLGNIRISVNVSFINFTLL